MTQLGIVAEPPAENRVSLSPPTAARVAALGYTVVVERGAGAASAFPDAAYEAAGATLVDGDAAWASDVVLAITPPSPAEIARLQPGATFIGLLSPALRPELLEQLAARGVTALALDAVPRISRAQSMDVLSSMANIAGYRAVVEAAHEFGRFFTGQVTAAGKVPPAKVLVAGAGVAGLAAIGAASSLGAIVRATDPRPEVAGKRIVTDNGVVILGYTDLAGRLPQQASQLYGTNLLNLLALVTPEKDGALTIDFEDVVQRAVTVVREGEITWPPPPVQVSAAPAATPASAAPATPAKPARRALGTAGKTALSVAGIAVLFLVCAFAPPPLPQHFLVLTLAVVVGFYVIGKVAHALHTPLMSVTNAISGIIVVGAMVQLTSDDGLVQVLAALAVLVASINIFGGFAVTRRMLAMFRKGDAA
jgi:NAD(P) transhydrogenase subunit alpha